MIEKVSGKYLEEGFGAETTQITTQEKPKKSQRKAKETDDTTQEMDGTTQEKPKKSQRKIDEVLIDLLTLEPHLSVRQLAMRLERTENSIRYHLRKMTEAGIVKHEGPTKSGKWIIIKR